MDPITEAKGLFAQNYSCAQSILMTFVERYGLTREEAVRIAAAFGGGILGTRQICGAVSGALMVIGLEKGSLDPDDKAGKERLYAIGQQFTQQFSARFGATDCRSLIGVDVSTPEKLQLAREQGIFTTLCPGLVGGATEMLEELLRG